MATTPEPQVVLDARAHLADHHSGEGCYDGCTFAKEILRQHEFNGQTAHDTRAAIADWLARLDILRYGQLPRGDLARIVAAVRTGDLGPQFEIRLRNAFECIGPDELDRAFHECERLKALIDRMSKALDEALDLVSDAALECSGRDRERFNVRIAELRRLVLV